MSWSVLFERVAHVERAGDVGRGMTMQYGWLVGGGLGVEVTLAGPKLRPSAARPLGGRTPASISAGLDQEARFIREGSLTAVRVRRGNRLRWMATCPSCGQRERRRRHVSARRVGPPSWGSAIPAVSNCPRTRGSARPAATPVAGAAAPGGQERKLVTVLFADVTGSTTLGERLDPERLREVLDAYFAAMREEIEAEGGTVEKFIGDAVMAAFGVPVAHEDDPARALRAALRHARAGSTTSTRSSSRAHDVTLAIRIGVNTGEVLATTDPRPGRADGHRRRRERRRAAAGAAEPGPVVVGERTVRAARGSASTTAGGSS